MQRLFIIFIAIITLFANIAYGNNRHIPLTKTSERANKKHKTNDLFKSYLQLSTFKNKVLAENLANANTPGYKANDVTLPDDYEGLTGKGKTHRTVLLAKTSGKHLGGSKGSDGKFSSHKLQDPYEIKKNGNNVSINQQVTKLSQNKNDYAAALKAYATTNSLYSSVLGK